MGAPKAVNGAPRYPAGQIAWPPHAQANQPADMVGVLNEITTTLKNAGISIFAISTW